MAVCLQLAITVLLIPSAVSVSCDWNYDFELDNGWKLSCQNGNLRYLDNPSLTEGTGLSLTELSTDGTLPWCGWVGDASYRGPLDCDDFVLSCYNNQLWSASFAGDVSRTATECSSKHSCAAPTTGSAVSCNFNAAVGFYGDHIIFRCIDGVLDSVELNNFVSATQSVSQQYAASEPLLENAQCTVPLWATPVGHWEQQSDYNGEYTWTVTIVTETSKTTTRSTEWAASLEASMEAGMEFAGIGATTSITTSMSQSIASELSSTLTISTAQTVSLTCNGTLWQWVVRNGRPWETEDSWETKVKSNVWRCTPGAEPQCPAPACIDDDCQTCKPYQGSSERSSFTPAKCDWTGRQRLSGAHDYDDFLLNCVDNVLTGVYHTEDYIPSSESCFCTWSGLRRFAGKNTHDDLWIECCTDGKLAGISAIDGDFERHIPGHKSMGIPCQWDGWRFAQGVHADEKINLYCEDGLLVEVRLIPDSLVV